MTDTLLRDLGPEAFRARYACSRFDATVLGNRFAYILEHFCSKLLACAFSPVLRDFYDFAATLTGPPERGYPTPVVSQSFIAFTGTMTESIRNTIEEYGPERLEPGDVIIANDPYRTGTHVNDLLFIRPVFHEGRLSGFVNLKCHQLDMGGAVPGGFSVTKTSTYENGLVLSPRALMKAGRAVDETWTLIFDNVRFGELLRRDMLTILACLDMGERLLGDSLRRYGREAVLGAMDYVCDADAERIRLALEALPDGDWRGEALLDCDGLDASEEYPVRCSLRKRGGRLEVDLSGTARQARTSINGTYLDTKTTVGVVLKFLLDPARRLHQRLLPARRHPDPGWRGVLGAAAGRRRVRLRRIDERAAGRDVPGALGAARRARGRRRHGRAEPAQRLRCRGARALAVDRRRWRRARAVGRHVGRRRRQLFDLHAGKLDRHAGRGRGGGPATGDPAARVPARHVGSGPASRRCGGAEGHAVARARQHTTCSRCASSARRASACTAVPMGRRAASGCGPRPRPAARSVRWMPGPTPSAWLAAWTRGRMSPVPTGNGSTSAARSCGRRRPARTFRYLSNGGGGWGAPRSRDPQAVLRDVRNGYVSVDGARRDYGVVVTGDPETDPEGIRLDAAATAALRGA